MVVIVPGVQCRTCFRYRNALGMADADFTLSVHCFCKSIRYNVKI